MPVDVFGQGAVQTAYVGYESYNLTQDLNVYWPNSYQNSPNVAPMFLQIATTSTTGLSLILPSAMQVSVGQNIIIFNSSTNAVNIKDNAGGTIVTLATGTVSYCIVTDNSTTAGIWEEFTFGTGTSQADAAQLAGLGLNPNGGKLNTQFVPTVITTDTTIAPTDNSKVFVWEGGAGNITLPPLASVNDGFFISFNQGGNGLLTIKGTPATIDQTDQLVLTTAQTCTLVKGSTGWWTIGLGQLTIFSVDVYVKDVSGNANVTLSDQEAAKNIHEFTGTLTGNIIVFYPNNLTSQWTITNKTTGNFTLTVQLTGGSIASVIAQTESAIFYSDGAELKPSNNSIDETNILFPNGGLSTPSVTFQSDTSTGMFLPGFHELGFTVAGTPRVDINTVRVDSVLPYYCVDGTATTPSYTFNSEPNTGLFRIPTGGLALTTLGSSRMNISGTSIVITVPMDHGSTTVQQQTLSNFMPSLPSAPVAGTIVWYNGTQWVNLAPPATGSNQKLTYTGGGVIAWT